MSGCAGRDESSGRESRFVGGKWAFLRIENLLILLILAYRKFISPLLPPCCRFYPTCSSYALEALKKRGLIIGSSLIIWRLLRCQPFCRGGYDPVPEKSSGRRCCNKRDDGLKRQKNASCSKQ